MTRNPWLKLAAVSFAGIIISFALLWGVNQFAGYSNQNNLNRFGYQNIMNSSAYGMNMQGSMNIQGNMMQGNMMQGNTNSGMGMDMMDKMMGMDMNMGMGM